MGDVGQFIANTKGFPKKVKATSLKLLNMTV